MTPPLAEALERADRALERATRSGNQTAFTFLALVALGTYVSYGLERTLWVMAAIFGMLLMGAVSVCNEKKAQVDALDRHEEKTNAE